MSRTLVYSWLLSSLLVVEASHAGLSTPQEVYQYHAELSIEDATSKIQKKIGGRVLGAKEEHVKGRVIYVIKVLTPEGRIRHYRVDSQSGKTKGPEKDEEQ